MRDLLASCHHRERGHLRLNESQMPSTSCAVRFEKVDALREATYRTPLFGRSLSTPLRFIFVGWKQRVTKRMERGFGTKTSIHPSALQNEWVQMRDGMYTLQTQELFENDAVLGNYTRAWKVFQVQRVGRHRPPGVQDDDVPLTHQPVLCQPTSLHPDRMVRAHKCSFGGLSWRVRLPWLVLRPGIPGVPEVVPNCTWPCCEC